MNADAMGKVLGPVADNIAMLLSGVDGFLHDLRDFSTVRAGSRMGIAFIHGPECRLLHSFGKHINNMLWHNSFDPGIHGSLCTLFMMVAIKAISTGWFRWLGSTMLTCTAIRGFRGSYIVHGITESIIETGVTGFHRFVQIFVLTCITCGSHDGLFLILC